MKPKLRLSLSWSAYVLLIGWVAASAPAQTRYVASDLGDLPGGSDSSRGYGINNLGQVVGGSRTTSPYGDTSGLEHPFLWTPTRPNGTTGALVDLGAPGGYDVGAGRAMNDLGQVVIDSGDANGQRPYLWTPDSPNGTSGRAVFIGPPVAEYHARTAAAINNRGQVVGVEDPGRLPQHGYLWTPSAVNGSAGTYTDLGELPGGYDRGGATAINARGQVVGAGDIATLPGDADAGIGARIRPFVWNPSSPNAPAGTMTALDVPLEYSASAASGINDAGQVVGRALGNTSTRAFLWTPDSPGASTGSLVLLGTSRFNDASDINNLGQVVGQSNYGRASLWDAEGGVRDLNGLLDAPLPEHWSLIDAVAINDAGQILARGVWSPDDQTRPVEHAFLLTPVPEPGWALLAVVAVGALLRRPATKN